MTENQTELQSPSSLERKLSFEEVPIELPILGELKLYHLRLEPEKDVGLAPLVFRGGVATPTQIQKGFLRGLEEGLPNLPIEVFSDPDSWVSLKPTSWKRLVARKNLEGQGWAFAKTIRQTLPDLSGATFLGFSAGGAVGFEAVYRANLAKPGTFKHVVLVEPLGLRRTTALSLIKGTIKDFPQYARDEKSLLAAWRVLESAWFVKYPVPEKVRRLPPVNIRTFWAAVAAASVDYYTPGKLRRMIERGGFEDVTFIIADNDRAINRKQTLNRLRATFQDYPSSTLEMPEGNFTVYQVGDTRVIIGEVEGIHAWPMVHPDRLGRLLKGLIPEYQA